MKHYDIVIIGSGLGGLECGYMLSKRGYNVCILEQHALLGGCLQTFKRSGHEFDTGFHYVGALEEGQFLHKLFRYFDLLNLPWKQMDKEGFAEVVFDDKSYLLANGYERFVDTLASDFPHQRKNLENYAGFLKKVGDNIGGSLLGLEDNKLLANKLFQQSAYSFLEQTVDDPLLRNVLSGTSLTMQLSAQLPLYIYAQINSSFIQSAWKLNGGGMLIADKLAESIRSMGGTIITKAQVTGLLEEEGRISAVEVNGDDRITADYVISNVHPAQTVALVRNSKLIRKIYRNRITNLPNTFGMFTTHLQLKKDTIPYINRNVFVYKDVQDVWKSKPGGRCDKALISYKVPADGGHFTRNIDILTPMHWEEVSQWADTAIGNRGEDYIAFKEQKANECIKLASGRIRGLENAIEKIYTSSPLTYRDYTGTWHGSAYGVQKDYNDILMTLLTPQTPVPNLLLTGQNLNLHGILGVSMTSFFTCAKITGMKVLIESLEL